jgi:lysyl-tRNA synthetase class II
MKIKTKRYIVWSADKEIDLSDPWQKKWYIKQVLTYGREEDIAELDWEEIKKLLPELDLPEHIKSLWEDYFASKK